MDGFKKNIYAIMFAVVIVFGFFISSSYSAGGIVHATGIEEETEVENTLEDEEVAEENTPETDVQTPEEVVPGTQIDDASLLEFEPLALNYAEVVTYGDVYNLLVRIYNFMLMCFIVALIMWTYNMITKAFRRFIY